MTPSKLPNGNRGTSLGSYSASGRFQANTAIGIGATIVQDVDVTDFDDVVILVAMTGTAIGDLAVTIVPIATDGSVHPAPLVANASAVILSGGIDYQTISINGNTIGLKGIEIQVKNNNVAAQTVKYIDVFASVTGVAY
jgi:hypothetical protein